MDVMHGEFILFFFSFNGTNFNHYGIGVYYILVITKNIHNMYPTF